MAVNILVNGKEVNVAASMLAYEDVVKLAGMDGRPAVTASLLSDLTGPRREPMMLATGHYIELREGAVFTVVPNREIHNG